MKKHLLLLTTLLCVSLSACDKNSDSVAVPQTGPTRILGGEEGYDPSSGESKDSEIDRSGDEGIKVEPSEIENDKGIITSPPIVEMPPEIVPDPPVVKPAG